MTAADRSDQVVACRESWRSCRAIEAGGAVPLGIVEAESGQVVGEREDGALDGEVMVGRVNVIRGGGEEEAGEDLVDGLGQDLLPDASAERAWN